MMYVTRWRFFLLAGAMLPAAVLAGDDDGGSDRDGSARRCACWYHGYEAALEFPGRELDRRAGSYQDCAGKGEGALYVQGFEAMNAGKPEHCPFAPPDPTGSPQSPQAQPPGLPGPPGAPGTK